MNNNAKTIKIYQASTHPPQRLEYRFLNSKNKKKKKRREMSIYQIGGTLQATRNIK